MRHLLPPVTLLPVRALARILTAAAIAVAGGTAPADTPPPSTPAEPPARAVELQRGVSWVGGPKEVTRDDLVPLVESHVGWIVQTPFGWQRRWDSPEIVLHTDSKVFWGERDVGIETTTRLARELGIRTLLKPHVWLREKADGKWRKDIRMASEDDWRAWFASYRELLLHYARLAARLEIEALCVGTELQGTVVEREQDWRRLIAEVRTVYPGQLTYAANWWREVEEVPFWDDLDFIGVQAYFPLAEDEHPSVEQLKAGWSEPLAALERLSRRLDRPVVFTEIGYRSVPHAGARPWEWPDAAEVGQTPSDQSSQANAYEAFFQTFWHRPWFRGAYFWKWYPGRPTAENAYLAIDFTPQGKAAERVLARWYEGTAAGVTTPR